MSKAQHWLRDYLFRVKRFWKSITLVGCFIVLGTGILLGSYWTWVSVDISLRFDQLRGSRPSQIYAILPDWEMGSQFRKSGMASVLRELGYRPSQNVTDLCPGCYQLGTDLLRLNRPEFRSPGVELVAAEFNVKIESEGEFFRIGSITGSATEGPTRELTRVEHPPQRIGVYSAGRLRTQDFVRLADLPVTLRLAVMGIEDAQFLEHRGVSFRAIARAFFHDVRAFRFAQGGSTITQQLMKNLFFSREKVFSRKIKEAFYAFVAEAHHSKEEILEAYLNEVYLGQSGSHEIHGMNEAARFYFARGATELTLEQGATLAALIQAPNLHDPRRHPDRLKQRRNVVLRRMLESQFIVEDEYSAAVHQPLNVPGVNSGIEDIDYYLELALAQVSPELRGRFEKSTLTVYLPIDPFFQRNAARAIQSQLKILQDRVNQVHRGKPVEVQLEGALIAMDVGRCRVVASQGGRSYRLSPFNRVLHGKRQVGSLIKPFVYLTGLVGDPSFGPTSVLSDSPFDWEYDRQVWSPKNYDEKFRGDVSARDALEQSLNVPTARLAQKVGIPAIIDVMRSAGISGELYPVPALSLGSVELSPFEMATAYLTIAREGRRCRPAAIASVYDENGNELFRSIPDTQDALPTDRTRALIDMMAGVISRGTARMALGRLGDEASYFVGKTGTTSDYRDAWFVGFSPDILVLVWVGYDERELVGLTGASIALPIWIDFIQTSTGHYLPRRFSAVQN